MLTLDRLFERTFERHGDRTAIHHGKETLTYGTFDDKSARLANVYRSLGLTTDDRVGILMDNRPEFIIAHTAAIRAGVTVIPLNKELDDAQVQSLLRNEDLDVLVVDQGFFDVVQTLQREHNELQHVIAHADTDPIPIGFHDLEELLARAGLEPPGIEISPDDTAAIYYTSGTTGEPKGVVHTHRSLTLNCYAHVREMNIRHDERMLLTTPLSHSAEPFARAGLAQGATILLKQEFDSQSVLETIEKERVTWTCLIPPMIGTLVDDKRFTETNTDSLRTIAYGAAPIPEPVLQRAIDELGKVFVQFYGLTEVPNLITVLPKSEHALDGDTLRSAGYPTELVTVQLLNIEEDWATAVGEIAVKSPYALTGYLGERTAYTEDGWLRTGDVGRIEDGRVFVLDRIQDVIVVDGEPVFSTTVEDVIQRHPDVKQVAVIGVPTDEMGTKEALGEDQRVKAVIVPTKGVKIETDELRELCQEYLDKGYPQSVDIVGQLPETPYGKVDKQALRDPYW
ncbi:MAG: class I adenylate-forming enzyme family protein [Halopenitus sp.]